MKLVQSYKNVRLTVWKLWPVQQQQQEQAEQQDASRENLANICAFQVQDFVQKQNLCKLGGRFWFKKGSTMLIR